MNNSQQQQDVDARYMAAAIRLARRNQGRTSTNPSVACVLVDFAGHAPRIVGTGVTAVGGRPHAEPIALARAESLAKGSTAYVSLEPCAHHGTTPPCAQALIDAGVSRVVVAVVDPDDRVSGKGFAMLEAADIAISTDVLASKAKDTIEGYLCRKNVGRPFVTLKLAVTETGVMGVRDGGIVPITGPVARSQVHLMRARHEAIMVGTGTAMVDDPSLDCRLDGMEKRSPIRVVLDANGKTSRQAKVVQTANKVPTYLVAPVSVSQSWQQVMVANHCNILTCDVHEGKIALPELLEDPALRGISSVMVEGGAKLASSLLEADLVDAIELFVGSGQVDDSGKSQIVYSSVTPGKVPGGFKPNGAWQFINHQSGGMDHQYRYERV